MFYKLTEVKKMEKQLVKRGISVIVCLLFLSTVLGSNGISNPTGLEQEDQLLADEWKQTFGGKETDIGYGLDQTADNGYILIGTTQSKGEGNEDIWLIKTNADGTLLWDKTFGGKNGDIGYAVKQTSDNGFILTGYTWTESEGKSDVWLIKTDSMGNEEWNTTIGGNESDIGYDVEQTSDGGYIILGSTASEGKGNEDVYLIKTDDTGEVEWTKTYGGSESDVGRSIVQTSDGKYIILGHTNSFGSGWFDLWMIKTEDDGTKMWEKTFGGGEDDVGWAIQETEDNGFICTGYTKSFSAKNQDIWLLKTDKDGTMQWSKLFGKSHEDRGYDVKQTADNGFIIIGNVHVVDDDLWLIKTDANGNEKWNKSYGKTETDIGRSVAQTSDGGYICTGWTRSYGAGEADVWLLKVGSQNHFPYKPSIVSGVDEGKTGTEYMFSAVATDLDDDMLWYQWNFGDGTISEWMGPYQSGEPCDVSHVWLSPNDFDVTVKVKDEQNAQSSYSDPYTVSISYQSAIFIGTITNKQETSNGFQFDAVTLISVARDPFEIKTVTDATYLIADEYTGLLLDSFIFGKFNIKQIT